MALSVPRPKVSSRFGPHDTALGLLENAPPIPSQELLPDDHCAPFQALCCMLRSAPNPKMSKRFGPHDVAAKELKPTNTPPQYSHERLSGSHRSPVHALWHMAPSGPWPKMS